jgi:hypothetical protein
MALLCNMSGESVFYYILNKEKEERDSIIENPQDIAQDIIRTMARKKK